MDERIYNQSPENLRREERIVRIQPYKVVNICLKEGKINSLLDIGTGSGLFAESFFNKNITVTGIDINKDMIKSAKKHLPKCKFLTAKAENVPFRKNTFDASFFGLSFHELNNYNKGLSEAFRVTKKFIFILEWKYKDENIGPPKKYRIKPSFLKKLLQNFHYKDLKIKNYKNFKLYIIKK
ncbi:MAG: class I SAM-dependent methyltransferase [Ignavibacteria bacterium]|nr:class I SAM-dependent methyltransferase [Ignavibacteria bacterium]